jgi:integrase
MRRTRYQFGTVYGPEPRKNGPAVWRLRYFDRETGERRSQVLGTVVDLPKRADAERAAEQYRLEANPDRPGEYGVSFGALLDRYIADEIPQRYSTRAAYQSLIKIHIRPKWGKYLIADVKPLALNVWSKALPLSAKTKNNIKWLLSSIFQHAVRLELVDMGHNPAVTIALKGVTRRGKKPVVLSAEQFQALASHLKAEPYHTLVLLAGCLGLRCSELTGLQWGDFDFDKQKLTIRRGVVAGREDEAKTEASATELPLHPLLADKLIQWRKVTPWKGENDWVFASAYRNGKKPLTLWNVQTLILKPAGKALEFGDIGWHTLRHTYRALLDKTGAPLGVQQKLMRHASITTTMNTYGDAYMDDKRAVNAAIVGRMIQ